MDAWRALLSEGRPAPLCAGLRGVGAGVFFDMKLDGRQDAESGSQKGLVRPNVMLDLVGGGRALRRAWHSP